MFARHFDGARNNLRANAEKAINHVADTLVGAAHPLRDETVHSPVVLPRDLSAHENVQTEWWYYTGQMQTQNGRRFGFELVFFKRRTDLDKFGSVPLRLLANPLYFAHFAVTELDAKTFRYAHRKSANRRHERRARARSDRYDLRLGDWTVREADDGAHLLRATLGDDLIFEARLISTKPVVMQGRGGIGVSFKDENEASRYFSYTRMKADGRITWRGETEEFAGWAWMDREFGTWTATENQKGWDWFSIQLDDTREELMVYHLRNSAGAASPFSSGAFVDADGKTTFLAREDFSIEPFDYWRSPQTGAVYPSGWRITIHSREIDLRVVPFLREQELDTRGTTMIVYWEGACEVFRTTDKQNSVGRAYVELVGYDRSHERPSLLTFLLGKNFNELVKEKFA